MTSPAFTLRTPTADDLPALFVVFKAAMRDYVTETYGPWDEDDQRQRFWTGFRLDHAKMIVADGEIVGAIDIERHDDRWHLHRIDIAPGWQGRVIGTALIGDLIARARSESLPITLQVLRVNPARSLYRRLGFVEVGETDTHYQMRRG